MVTRDWNIYFHDWFYNLHSQIRRNSELHYANVKYFE
jgi:hypothetical protein